MNPASSDVVVGRLDVDWRVDTELDVDQSARLETLLDRLRDDVLEDALTSAVESRWGERCLRHVEVAPVGVRWSSPDSALLDAWSSAIAGAVVGATRLLGTDNVWYPSVSSARQDLVVSVLEGDRSRVWAWQLLGLWESSSWSDAEAVTRTLTATAADQPVAIGSLFVDIARGGHLEQVLEWLGFEGLGDVAEQAWLAAGGTVRSPGRPAQDLTGRHPNGIVDALVALVVRHSELLAAFAANGTGRGVLGRGVLGFTASSRSGPRPHLAAYAEGLARLAVLEVEPAAAARPVAGTVVARLVSELTRAGGVSGSESAPSRSGKRLRSRAPGTADADDHAEGPRDRARVAPEDGETETPPARAELSDGARRERDDATPDDVGLVELPPPTSPETSPSSSWGGLLFLLNVIDDLDLATRVLAEPERFGVGLRGRLYLLGRELVRRAAPDAEPMRPDDPAILSFCGLGVDDAPPVGEPTPIEWFDEEVATVVTTLRDRLDVSDGAAGGDQAVLASVLRRRTRIDASPGWIDVELDLDEVTIDVRRAGLDLDPGYLSWLGVVVRFRYV